MKTQKTQTEDLVIKGIAATIVIFGKVLFFLLIYQLLISVYPGLAILPMWQRVLVAISSIIMSF